MGLVVIAIIASVGTLFLYLLFFPFTYINYLQERVLKAIVSRSELDAGLKNEAKAILESKEFCSYVFATDWIKLNKDQFSGELLAVAKREIVVSRICDGYLWLFVLWMAVISYLMFVGSLGLYGALGLDGSCVG